jgi:hypothetical protein
MLVRVSPPLLRFCVALLFAAALVLLPFGHRATAGNVDPALEAFLAAGGTAADICGGVDPAHGARGCDACRLTVGLYLPPTPGKVAPMVRWARIRHAYRALAVLPRNQSGPVSPARAPPVV